MPIRVKCESCKKTLSVKDHLAGKKIKCPVCETVVAVPSSSPAKTPPPTASPAPVKPAGPGAKPAVATKPPVDKTKTNGTPSPGKAQSNGAAPPSEPFVPPEYLEDEAASAFADEPPPVPVEEETPKTIDFKCSWCDEDVKLPLEMGGKQAPCPNPECRRIIKVPMPKAPEKKDWRKMDRRGPAAAILNQPEQLDDAWGTEEATRARQDSLAQAGVIDLSPKRPIGVFGWIRRGFITTGVVAACALLVLGIYSLYSAKQQVNAVKQVESMVVGKDAKIVDKMLLAEAHRTIGLLYFHSEERKRALPARRYLQASASLIQVNPSKENPAINEQMVLLDVALSQIELGGDESESIGSNKVEWKIIKDDLATVLQKIKTPELQVIVLREVGSRLVEKSQTGLAISLATALSNADDPKKPPDTFRQQIAMLSLMPDQAEKLSPPPKPAEQEVKDAHTRVGYAEGFARKKNFDEALAIAQIAGPARDRLDTLLGVVAIALHQKNKTEAAKLFKEALSIVSEKDAKGQLSLWHQLQLVKLGARLEDPAATEIANSLPTPFKMRAYLEIFLALCDRSTGKIDAERLVDLESDSDGGTLALAWVALSRHNVRHGGSRDSTRRTFEDRAAVSTIAPAILEKVRPMVDIGSHLGSMK